MTEYVKSTNFASKDALPSGNPLKIVKGTEIDSEFNNIATAVSTKADLLNPVFTGVPTAPTAAAGTSTTQIATTAFATAVGSSSVSPGAMLMWPLASAPGGFLLCNGQSVSRTTYSALFAVLGVVFGSGDGSTTFTLPDYRDRMPVGAGASYSANSTGGSKDAVVVSHSHSASVSDPSHVHSSAVGNGFLSSFGGIGEILGGGSDVSFGRPPTTAAAVTGISVSVNAAGSSGSNANLPPYLGIYFIIKT